MKAAECHLLIFEGASAGQHVAAGAAWVDLPKANPTGRASRERASQYPHWSRPSEQRHNDERLEPHPSLRSSPKDETVGRRRGKKSTNGFSPAGCGDSSKRPQSLWLCGLALCLPGRCFASVTAARCGDALAKPPCPRPILPATASMRLNQRFPKLAC